MSQAELIPAWQEIVSYSADGPRHQQLIETDDYKAVLVGLEADQKIPPHPAAAATYHFLDGTGTMVVDGERLAVRQGATVVVPAGVPRGVEADTRLAFLGSHGVPGAKETAGQPFKKVGLAAMLGMILMWGFMILPFAGMLIMFAMMFVFYRLAVRSSGSMASMMGHGGLMAGMMGHKHDREQSQPKETHITTHTYDILSVNCGHCRTTIEQKVGERAGIASVSVDVTAKQAVIMYNPPATKSEIETLLTKIDYPPLCNQ